jgi:type II secretory pathway component PulF
MAFLETLKHNLKDALRLLLVLWRRQAFPAQKREQVWRLVADLLGAQIPLNTALETAAKTARGQGQSSIAAILLDIEAGIVRRDVGLRVAGYVKGPEALVFNSIGRSDPERMFRAASRLAAQQHKIRSAIVSALALPVLLTVLMAVTFFVMGLQLFPALESIGRDIQMSWGVSILSATSQWFATNALWILVPLAVAGIMVWVSVPRWSGRGRDWADRIPPYSLYKLAQGAGFIYTVIELGRMGQTLNTSLLNSLSGSASSYTRSRIKAIEHNMSSGRWGAAMQATGHQFPARDLITVTEALDGTEGWVEKFATYLDRWLELLEERVKAQVRVLNTILLFAIAAQMGAVATAIMSIFSML